MEDGREADDEKDDHDEGHTGDEEEDGGGAGGVATLKLDGGDAVYCGHQDCREERADVDDQQFFLQVPGKSEEEEDADGEEDVAAYVLAGLVGVGDEGGRWGGQRDLLLRNSGCARLDAESLPDGRSGLGVWRLVQGGEDGFDGALRGEVGGVDGETGEAGVERMPVGEAELGGGGVFEDRVELCPGACSGRRGWGMGRRGRW